ncbi:C1 family peptidase [Butyrivibrio sp. WCE2006]|uniref:C1 family peptidase n=1 Tax=Butyrivibrio sp. WCE2006 TaxID=1410611 RepID=UPI0005D14BF7|nr:C1 family peptidase [Butyrivibrio sp. WCE2006]
MIRKKSAVTVSVVSVAVLNFATNCAFTYEDTKTVIPIDIPELTVSEAIVIDDDEDLEENIDGTECDYKSVISDGELPSFYSSDQVEGRDYVTPVRNQGISAMCWNYAAIGAVESDLLRHHDNLSADSLNLSEKHGAYYNMHKASGKEFSGIENDYREFVFINNDSLLGKYDTGYLSVGGVTDYSLSVLTAWKGPVEDEDSDSLHVIKGVSDFYAQNADVPTDAYESFCHVQDVLEVPATAKNRDIIKRMIMEHGSVTASICSDDEFWTGKKVALYDYKDYGNGNYADHEILIVGWNDDYPAQNFITKPGIDGAFICKNSWGTKSGAQGYFYLSYEDKILTGNNAVAYSSAMPEDDSWYDRNYQYAGFITQINDPIKDQKNVVYMYDNNNAAYGISFTPEGDEVLSAIGYFTMSTASDDEISVYEVSKKEIDEDNAKVLAEMIGRFDEANDMGKLADFSYVDLTEIEKPVARMKCKAVTGGFHTFKLDNPLEVQTGKEYLIVIRPGKKTKLIYEKAMDYTTEAHKDEWQHNMGAIHTVNTASGHSYQQDLTGNFMIKQTDKDFFVKAYTVGKN